MNYLVLEQTNWIVSLHRISVTRFWENWLEIAWDNDRDEFSDDPFLLKAWVIDFCFQCYSGLSIFDISFVENTFVSFDHSLKTQVEDFFENLDARKLVKTK